MVSSEKCGFTRPTAVDEEVERLTGMWASIDVITEINLDRTVNRAARQVGIDHGKDLLEQIVSPVDVTDGIDSNSVRQPVLSRNLPGSKKSQHNQCHFRQGGHS